MLLWHWKNDIRSPGGTGSGGRGETFRFQVVAVSQILQKNMTSGSDPRQEQRKEGRGHRPSWLRQVRKGKIQARLILLGRLLTECRSGWGCGRVQQRIPFLS